MYSDTLTCVHQVSHCDRVLPFVARLSGDEDEDPDYEEIEAVLHSEKKVCSC